MGPRWECVLCIGFHLSCGDAS